MNQIVKKSGFHALLYVTVFGLRWFHFHDGEHWRGEHEMVLCFVPLAVTLPIHSYRK